MQHIDLGALSDALAERVAHRIFESFDTSALAEQLLHKHGDDLQAGITVSILQHLQNN